VDTLRGVTGCDSIITSIIGYNHVEKSLNFEICKGESIIVNNKAYTQAGIFRDTILKSDGCDSILVISLIVHPTYSIDTIFEICKGGSIIVGNSTYFNAGNFTELLQTKKGCDSLVNFEIRIINFVPIFSVIRDTLRTVNLDGAQYQWHECRNGDKVPFLGAVSSEFIILKSGQYSLSITYKGCTYFSDCIDIILSSSAEYFTTGFKYFPNPVSGVLSLETESIGSLKIVSIFGQVYSQYQINALKEDIDLKDLVPGTYYLIFESQNKKSYHKLIKH
jgi:hypothetical protein